MIPLRLLTAALGLCAGLAAQPRTACVSGHPWWRHAVFYEVYPRSFQDSSGSGVGDLPGLTSRLDYLRDLGVDALWLTPVFPSPQVDFGYDVSGYRDIDPAFGSLRDFDRLLDEAGSRDLRVLLDLVLNHTSDRHPWFLESRASRTSPRRDWYVWRDGRGPGRPPNNWESLFGGSAWTLDPATGQYYYHFFYAQQPDLNWRNRAVEREMLETTRFWYRRGVAGFRLDSVDALLEDEGLRDNPILPGRNPFGDANMVNCRNFKQPGNHRILRALRRAADPFGAVLVGETYCETARELRAYYGAKEDEVQLPTGHMLAMAPSLSAADFRRRIAAMAAMGRWPVWVLGNHDLPRVLSRYGDGRHDAAIAKLLAALQLTLRGTPILYYGEELGMVDNNPTRPEDVRDPMARTGWPAAKRRDGARTPMQWEGGPGAGFTRGRPWLPIPASAAQRNVAVESRDPDSVLSTYRRLLALRRASLPLLDGDFRFVNGGDPEVLAYLRETEDEAVLVTLNLSPRRRTLSPDLAGTGYGPPRDLLRSGAGAGLEPFGWRIQALRKATVGVPDGDQRRISRRSACTPAGAAAMSPVSRQSSAPFQSLTRPPASATRRTPAAKSQRFSPISK
jgi:alpha-glucosidase